MKVSLPIRLQNVLSWPNFRLFSVDVLKMIRIASPSRLITWTNVFLNVYMRNFKKFRTKKSEFLQLRLFHNCFSAGLITFVQTVYCTNKEKDSVTKGIKEGQKNVTMNIIQCDEYFKVGKYEESYKSLQPFEEVDNAEILWRIARSLYYMSKENNINSSNHLKLITHAYTIIDRALKLDDQNYAVHKWMAVILDAKLKTEGSKARLNGLADFKKHLRCAMELNPKDATTIYILGQYCYYIAGMPWYQKKIAAALLGTPPESTYEEALHYFSKAEEVEPNFYSLNLLMLGKTYLQLNNIEAARYWLKCASTYPIRTEEDRQVRKEAEELLKKYAVKFEEGGKFFSEAEK